MSHANALNDVHHFDDVGKVQSISSDVSQASSQQIERLSQDAVQPVLLHSDSTGSALSSSQPIEESVQHIFEPHSPSSEDTDASEVFGQSVPRWVLQQRLPGAPANQTDAGLDNPDLPVDRDRSSLMRLTLPAEVQAAGKPAASHSHHSLSPSPLADGDASAVKLLRFADDSLGSIADN